MLGACRVQGELVPSPGTQDKASKLESMDKAPRLESMPNVSKVWAQQHELGSSGSLRMMKMSLSRHGLSPPQVGHEARCCDRWYVP